MVEIPRYLSVDVDEPVDLIVAEEYFKDEQVKREMEME